MEHDQMAHPRLFRFGVQGRSLGPTQDWLAMLRRAEGFGYTSYLALDHFVRGFDTVASLAAAAMVTSMQVGSFVFDNDFRHPALTAKAAATIDVLSDGRFEFGIGAGWLKEEYDQTGIPFEPAGLRVAKLAEAVRLIKIIFMQEHPVSFTGEHYTVTDLICTPKPPSRPDRPHPPFIIGGGSQKILTLAGQEADIVGITTRARPDGSKDSQDLTAAATERKFNWVREAASDRFADLELNMMVNDIVITAERDAVADRLAGQYGLTRDEILESPLILIGSVDEMVAALEVRRERYGFSYICTTEPNMTTLAPVVARLAGR
jgi:probable F420-dependent oxidoreductase